MRQRFSLGPSDAPYSIRVTEQDVSFIMIGRYGRLHFEADLDSAVPDLLDVNYSVLLDEDPRHRGLLVVEYNSRTGVKNETEAVSLIFTPDRRHRQLDLTDTPGLQQFLAFVAHGIHHIWIGLDHILFLITLVLASVLRRTEKGWEPVESFRPALINVAKIVTLFTVAHSITLSLAALDLVQLPSRFVESVIAASVLLAALNNIYPFFKGWTWTIIFAFGLFHGFGFAGVLGHLAYNNTALVRTLLGFNVGVELGQLAIIGIAFPLAYAIRSRSFYDGLVLKFGSFAIALVALMWLMERAFGVTIG